MKKKEVESRLRRAYTNATPDVLQAVREGCAQTKGENLIMLTTVRPPSVLKKIVAVAAAVLLVVGAAAGIGAYQAANRIETTVSLDVNPALAITLNKNEKVLAVTPHNDEAAAVIGDMELAGNDLTLVINALIGSMLREGYLDEATNSILVSVEDADRERGASLQSRLSEQIDGLLQADALSGSVLSQTVTPDEELTAQAEQNAISVGKAKLIRQILSEHSRHTFEELAPLSIHELNLISGGAVGRAPEEVKAVGTASEKDYIGAAAAKDAAWYAVVGDADVAPPAMEADMDYENGRMIYEVEFVYDAIEYDFDIDAVGGEVVKLEKEHLYDEEDWWDPTTVLPTTTTAVGSTTSAMKEPSTTTASTTTTAQTTTTTAAPWITAERAREIAIAHAGVTADAVLNYTCEAEHDDGVRVYEIDFTTGKVEYDYTIDAKSGKILDVEKDAVDRRPTTTRPAPTATTTSANRLSVEKAQAVALAHAGVTADDIHGYRCELDEEDGKWVYEIEFSVGKVEYDYTVSATDGKVLAFDKDTEDDRPATTATTTTSALRLTEEEAKTVALTHAQVAAADIRGYTCETDKEDGKVVYEIEFSVGNTEYSYTIDVYNGDILDFDKEIDD